MSQPTVGTNTFATRQTAESEFTHFEGSFDEIAALAEAHLADAKPGYRDGVCLVPVPAAGFFCGVVELQEGDKLEGEFRARRQGEDPRKSVHAAKEGRSKSPCVAVDVVLYRKDVLAEDGNNSTACEWEIVSINGRITEEEQPIHPNTLIANHFGLSGGTQTGMSAEEFEAALRVSVAYWKNRAILAR